MMLYVSQSHTIEELIKKSRFIGVITPCENEQDILRELKTLQVSHPHADHIVFAYRLKHQMALFIAFMIQVNPLARRENRFFNILKEKTSSMF